MQPVHSWTKLSNDSWGIKLLTRFKASGCEQTCSKISLKWFIIWNNTSIRIMIIMIMMVLSKQVLNNIMFHLSSLPLSWILYLFTFIIYMSEISKMKTLYTNGQWVVFRICLSCSSQLKTWNFGKTAVSSLWLCSRSLTSAETWIIK